MTTYVERISRFRSAEPSSTQLRQLEEQLRKAQGRKAVRQAAIVQAKVRVTE